MIEKLQLKNFQNHSNLTIEFGPITTIVGPSDAGKSAVLRALYLVTQNKPKGKAFIKDGKKFCAVKLTVDGKTITRKRGTHNVYLLDGSRFKAFGNRVPERIEKVLNLGPVNFQRQLDLPYWFAESPGQVSKNLNEIVNLQAIDEALSKVSSEVRASVNRCEVTRERLAEARATVKELKWVPQFLKDCKELLELEKERDEIVERNKELRKLIKESEGLKSVEVPDLGPLLALRKKADKVAEDRRELEMAIDDYEKRKDELKAIQAELIGYKAKLEKFKGRCPLCHQVIPKSLRSASRIYTSPKSHQCLVPKKTSGTPW